MEHQGEKGRLEIMCGGAQLATGKELENMKNKEKPDHVKRFSYNSKDD